LLSPMFAYGAVLGAVVAVWLSTFPKDHWVRQTRPRWTGLVVIAVIAWISFGVIF
jgi:hypothetical protein